MNQPGRDVAQSGSAPRSGRGGRWFESTRPDHFFKPRPRSFILGSRPSEARLPAIGWGHFIMRNLIVGAVVGLVVGIVFGTTIIAPRLKLPAQKIARASAAMNAPAAITTAANSEASPAAAPPPNPAHDQKLRTQFARTPAAEPDRAALRWRMASAYASSLPQLGALGKRLETMIWQISDGDIEFRYHEPGTLVAPAEMFDAVRAGAIDAAFAAPGVWAQKDPAFLLFSGIPFGPPIQEFIAWIYVGGGHEILQDLYHKQGVHTLICGVLAPEGSGWFRRPVKTLEDFKALRLGMNGLAGKVAEKLGANVIELAEGDVYVAMERGLIDGAEASQPAVDLNLGLHQLAKYYYFPSWHQPATLLNLIVNLAAWQALEPVQRAQINAACGDNVRHGLAEGHAKQFDALKELTKLGVRIETWAPDILDALKAAWQSVATKQSKSSRNFKRAWRSLQTFRDEFGIWREIGDGTSRR